MKYIRAWPLAGSLMLALFIIIIITDELPFTAMMVSTTELDSLPEFTADGESPISYSAMYTDLTNDGINELITCLQRMDEP